MVCTVPLISRLWAISDRLDRTGASDGIGYAVAEGMAEAGADVVMWYNTNDAAIKKGAALAEKHGVKVKAYQVNVTDAKKVEEAIDKVVSDFGQLDVRASIYHKCCSATANMNRLKCYSRYSLPTRELPTQSPSWKCRWKSITTSYL